MQAYCLKCRAHRDIGEANQVTLKNGRPATRGTCSVCSATVFMTGTIAVGAESEKTQGPPAERAYNTPPSIESAPIIPFPGAETKQPAAGVEDMNVQGAIQDSRVSNSDLKPDSRSFGLLPRVALIVRTSFNIAATSLLHPGKPIEINRDTGIVRVMEEQ